MPEIIQRSFTKGEVSPSLHARADLTFYTKALKTLKNFFVEIEGGVSTRPGFRFVGELLNPFHNVRLIPFQFNTEQTYIIVLMWFEMHVILDGNFVTETPISITAISNGPNCTVTAANTYVNGDHVFLTGIAGMEELNNGWFYVINAAASSFELYDIRTGLSVDSSFFGNYTAGGTAAKIYSLVTPYSGEQLFDIKYTQSADVMTLTHKDHPVKELARTAHDNWTLTTVDYTTSIVAPTGLTVVLGPGTGCGTHAKTYEYVVTVVINGVESLPSSPVFATVTSLSTTCYMILAWDDSAGAEYYNIYKAESDTSGVYGWIGKSLESDYKDYNKAGIMTDSPPVDYVPFATASDYPSAVNYYQQRLLFGATINKPQTVYGTQSGNYQSFRRSQPLRDDDSIEFTVASQKVNEIRHIVSLDALLLLTSGGEWKVTEGDQDILTPYTLGVKPQSYYGASNVAPIVVGSSAIYVQERGTRVRNIAYTFESDNYQGNDLSILSQHLFSNYTIVDMAYSQEPNSTIYAVRSDGTLLACAYNIDHEIIAWSPYTTPNGLFKSVAVIAEGSEDVLYAAIERIINGFTRVYVERLEERNFATASDSFCVDAGTSYDGTAITSLSGLRHLEGETISLLIDGVVATGDVANGLLTLPFEGTKIHAGLSYECDFETLAIDSDQLVVRGKKKSVNAAVFKFIDSRGGHIGTSEDDLVEIKPRLDEHNYSVLELRSYEERFVMPAGWTQDGQVFFRQSDPLPVTIIAAAPEVDIG